MRFSFLALVLAISPSVWASGSPAIEVDNGDASYQFALAQMYRFEGAYEEALDAFKRAVAAAPEDPFLRLEFAEFLLQTGRVSEAVEHAETARRAAPRDLDVMRLLSSIHLRLADSSSRSLERAEEALSTVRQLDPQDTDARVTLGRIYLSRGEAAPAVEVLKEAQALEPRDRMVSSLLVDALAALGEPERAATELEELIADDPTFLRPRLALVSALSELGRLGDVIRILEEAPEEVTDNSDYLRQLAYAYYQVGSFDRSLEATEAWLERRPDDTRARYLAALNLSVAGRQDEAEAMLSELLEDEPQNIQFAVTLAEMVSSHGGRQEAIDLLRRQIATPDLAAQPDDLRRLTVMLVDLYSREGAWEELLALADEVIEPLLAEGDPLRLLRSRALEQLGRREEALADLERLERYPSLADQVAARRAVILQSLGRAAEAASALSRLVDSDDLGRLMLAAEALHEAGLFAEAVPVLQRAESLSNESLDVLFLLAASYERSGRPAEAEETFRRLLEIDGDFAPALNYLGYMWADADRNLDEALELIERAVALDPDNGAYVDSLGWAYFRKGDLEQAREHLERAASLVGNDAVVHEHLGDLYRAMGRVSDALTAYRRAIALEGENLDRVLRKLTEIEAE